VDCSSQVEVEVEVFAFRYNPYLIFINVIWQPVASRINQNCPVQFLQLKIKSTVNTGYLNMYFIKFVGHLFKKYAY